MTYGQHFIISFKLFVKMCLGFIFLFIHGIFLFESRGSKIINQLHEEVNNKNVSYLYFFITLFVFLPAILDIVFSYMDMCQEMEYITTLNRCFRFLCMYSLVYYTFIFLSIYFLYIRNRNENYTRMYNIADKNARETNNYFFRIFICIFTIFILVIYTFITYSYFKYFSHYCRSYTIIIYVDTSSYRYFKFYIYRC